MLAEEAEVRARILRQLQEMSQEDQKLFLTAIWKQCGDGLSMTVEGLSALIRPESEFAFCPAIG